jgi:hypothetical protein
LGAGSDRASQCGDAAQAWRAAPPRVRPGRGSCRRRSS